MVKKDKIILFLLVMDFILLILAFLNLSLLWNKAGLPKEYKANINSFSFDVNHINAGEKVIEFDGKITNKPGLVDFYLMYHRIGDTVNIKSLKNDNILVRKVILIEHYTRTDLIILVVVMMFYFFTGIYILLKFSPSEFAYVLHMLSIFTATMVIFDWGDLITYNRILNFILLTIFEIGNFMVPTLFLHFSFSYPVSKSKFKPVVLVPFYFTSFVCIIISISNLAGVIFFNVDVSKAYYLPFHTYIADIFLVIGLILTIATLEHSALIIPDALSRKRIYWALLGISLGPLVYVFLRLVPRLLLGYELVSEAFMDFTIIVAPIMLLISVSSRK